MYISVFSAAFDPPKSRRRLDEKNLVWFLSKVSPEMVLRSKFFEIRTTLNFLLKMLNLKISRFDLHMRWLINIRRNCWNFQFFRNLDIMNTNKRLKWFSLRSSLGSSLFCIFERFIFFCLSLSVFSLKLKMNCDKCNRFRLGRCEFDSETLI